MEGKIKFVNHAKFYGIVENEGGSWFFREDAVLGDPVMNGDDVTFALAEDPRRPGDSIAIDVERISGAAPADPSRLFVANLPYSANEVEIVALFEAHGDVDRFELIRHPNGESRGFGFCEMRDDRSALSAIAALHGSEFAGRLINVSFAQKGRRSPAKG